MRTLLTGGALGVLVLALAACGASSVTSGDKATQRRVDLYEISQLERSFHEAITVAAKRRPDLILLDLRLPDMDGTDVARELRGGAETGRIPVVALSASPLAGGSDRLLATGFDGYLQKPIDVRAFPQQVRRYCRADRV